MSKNVPVDARVRLAIAQEPSEAPRGAVTAFCAEHGISCTTSYVIRTRAPSGKAGRGTGATVSAASQLPDTDHRRGEERSTRGTRRVGVLGSGSRADQRARQDGCPGHGAGAVDCVADADLPCRQRRAARAEEEATSCMATVRLPGSERLLAARRRRARPPRRTYKHERIGRRRRPVREATQQAECGVAPRNEAQRDLVARRW